jgi:hypothetical protein
MVVFVEEDVAANDMWQEAEDGQTDSLPFLLGNVSVFALRSLEAACLESDVRYCPLTIPRTVAVYVCQLDRAVDVLAICVAGCMCPPL